MNDMDLTLWH
nr:unnamed protein product [Callosobruchus analis]